MDSSQTAAKPKRGDLSRRILDNITPEQHTQTYKQMAIAAAIADALDMNGWSKREFATRMNRQPSMVTRWLSGTHNFTIETLLAVEATLGVQLITIAGPKSIRQELTAVHG